MGNPETLLFDLDNALLRNDKTLSENTLVTLFKCKEYIADDIALSNEEEGCVLFAGNEIDDYLYSVGGGVHMNEKAEDAVVREVLEETGVRYEGNERIKE